MDFRVDNFAELMRQNVIPPHFILLLAGLSLKLLEHIQKQID